MNVDYLIVGHGLAGAALAWQLRWLGQRVAVVDNENPQAASRIATGLITPITGRRHSLSYRFPEFVLCAREFYNRVEEATGVRCLLHPRTLKIIDDKARRQLYEDIRCQPFLSNEVQLDPPFRPRAAVELRHALRLDVKAFLAASKQQLQQKQSYRATSIDVAKDVQLEGDKIRIARLNCEAKFVVYCQGIHATSNQLFGPLPFQPAKGEILELRTPTLQGYPALIGDAWIVPTNDGGSFLGATYEQEYATDQPTDAGRRELLRNFDGLCESPVEVVGHQAAIRPVVRGRLPQFFVDQDRRIAFFNGLGSKGSLRAPMTAEQLARYLVSGEPVDEEFWYDGGSTGKATPRLTAAAQGIVAEAIRPGDTVVDATAGNGHDTLFLSQSVGPRGTVFAIDVQADAIARTAAKLTASSQDNVTLIQGSHAKLSHLLPKQIRGTVAAIMFNLGYLPRGEKEITTKSATTLQALEQALLLLKPGGLLTIVAYTGHPAGYVETLAIEHWANTASTTHTLSIERPPTRLNAARPRLYVFRRPLHSCRRVANDRT